MKLLLISIVAAISSTYGLEQDFIDEFIEKMQDIGTKCAAEENATSDDIAELLAKKLPPSRHEAKCLIFCMQKSFDLMKADGTINRSGAMQSLKPLQKQDANLYQKLVKVFVTCGMRVKPQADPCETATALLICGNNEATAMGLDESILNI